jgi:hypothetical protein
MERPRTALPPLSGGPMSATSRRSHLSHVVWRRSQGPGPAAHPTLGGGLVAIDGQAALTPRSENAQTGIRAGRWGVGG